jgi:proteasome lid subunit RPN8/RPN11
MISSALEVFPLETYGVVSGDVREERITCTVAQAVQMASRSETSVLPHSAEILRALIQEITRTIGIGSFHSHPSSGLPLPSDADVDAFEAAGDVIHFILGISPTEESDKDFTSSSLRVDNRDRLLEIPVVLVGTVAQKKVVIGCYSISQETISALPIEIGSSYSPRICTRCGGILRSNSATCPYCEANMDS